MENSAVEIMCQLAVEAGIGGLYCKIDADEIARMTGSDVSVAWVDAHPELDHDAEEGYWPQFARLLEASDVATIIEARRQMGLPVLI